MSMYVDVYAEMRGEDGKWTYGGLYRKNRKGEFEPAPIVTGQSMVGMAIDELEIHDVAVPVFRSELSPDMQKLANENDRCYEISCPALHRYARREGDRSGWVLDEVWQKGDIPIGEEAVTDEELAEMPDAVREIVQGHRHYRFWVDPEGGLALAREMEAGLTAIRNGYFWDRDGELEYRLVVIVNW